MGKCHLRKRNTLTNFCIHSPPVLTLFVDRAIFNSSLIANSDWNDRKSVNLKEEAYCLFDKIIYFDDLPLKETTLNMKRDKLEYAKVSYITAYQL